MSTTITYTVSITFEDKIYSDENIREIGNNIIAGLVNQANTIGLSPENSDTFTKAITVSKDGIELAQYSYEY